MDLARHYGITEYPAPAGGCLLTDPGFSRRLRDLMQNPAGYDRRDLDLLRHGRHLRLDPETRVVVGRSRLDNEEIQKLYDQDRDTLVRLHEMPGPTLLIPGGASAQAAERAAAICAAYSKTRAGREVRMQIRTPEGTRMVTVTAADTADLKPFLL